MTVRAMMLLVMLSAIAEASPKFDVKLVPAGTTWWCSKMTMCFRTKPACEQAIGPCKSQVTAWAYTDSTKQEAIAFDTKSSCTSTRKGMANADTASACTAVGKRPPKPFKPSPKGTGYWCFARKPGGAIPAMCARDQETCESVHKISGDATTECHATKSAWAFVIEEDDNSIDAPIVETKAQCTAMYEQSYTAVGPCREIK